VTAVGSELPAKPTTAVRRLGVVPELDGVRGLAVLLVVITHLQFLIPFEVTGISRVDTFIEGSYLGVDLFFVLSGFLITALLLSEVEGTGTIRFGSFYARRALRLLPALYFMLLCHAFYAVIVGLSWLQEWATIRSALLYVSNWQLVFRPLTAVPDLGLLWSLAIEEQFYLLWPAVLVAFFGLRQRAGPVAAGLGVMILAVALWRAHLWQEDVFWAQLAVRTDTRIDALLIGALLASLWVRGATPTRGVNLAGWVGLATILGILATFDITTGVGYLGGLTVFSVATALVILALVNGTWGGARFFDLRPLRAIGRVSYGIYLWHYPIFYAVAVRGRDLTNTQRVLLAGTLTAAATLTSWYLIERPALSFKRRFTRRSPTEPVPARPALPTVTTRHRAPLMPSWHTGRGKAVWALTALAVVATVGVGRLTVFADPSSNGGPAEADGLPFPSGDTDRIGYWGLVELDPLLSDTFDRADIEGSLQSAETGQPWSTVSGTWGIVDEAASASGEADERLAVAALAGNDGLIEVTLTTIADGAGLVFRYIDADNYWAVTADTASQSWQVTQVVDGNETAAGQLIAPTVDGTTVTVTLNDQTIRVLIEGVEYLRLLDPPPEVQVQAGMIASGPEAPDARWDRFLVMVPRVSGTGG
jgi:peptidoglycan/LPS O-acetylase OafA/YrhL